MTPDIWGPIFWKTLHIASLGYIDKPTPRQKKNIQLFYESMVDVLPCEICRKHYAIYLCRKPVKNVLSSRLALVTWVFDMHNAINISLGKPAITFDEYMILYSNNIIQIKVDDPVTEEKKDI
jgi:uncharacterized CHY-type Zn-finger protein